MSALRRAGVWLGLVEDEDDLYDDEPVLPERDRRSREAGRVRQRHHHDDDEFGYEDAPPSGEDVADSPDLPGRRIRGSGSRRGGAEASVRSITRDPNVSYLTRDSLALAPRTEPEPSATGPERRYQITTLHPTTYREARTIGEHFRDGTPVIMNLTEMDEADARRLVDFGAGLAFGLRGTMERVTNRVFLLSPANIQVTPEDKAKIAEGGFFRHS
jgi:cell division inhibitor SepF